MLNLIQNKSFKEVLFPALTEFEGLTFEKFPAFFRGLEAECLRFDQDEGAGTSYRSLFKTYSKRVLDIEYECTIDLETENGEEIGL